MASDDLFLSQLRGLSLLESWGDYNSSIYGHLKDFAAAILYLSRFVSCIRHWSNVLEVAPHFGYLATKVEASVQKLKGEFSEELRRDKRASVFKAVSFNLSRSLLKRAWKWISFFQQSKAKIDVLKQEIAEACDNRESIIINSVKCISPLLDFDEWKEFVISTNFHVPNVCDNLFPQHSRRPGRAEIRLVEGPSFFEDILHILGYDNLRNPKIEAFWVKIGSSIISAGMLSCRWWAKNFDANIKQDVDAALRDLGQKVSLTNPEFIDIILREQKCHGKLPFDSIAGIFVIHLIPSLEDKSPNEYVDLATLINELRYLLTTVVNIPKEDALLQIFLPDIKQLVLEIASLHHLLFDVKDRNVFMDLLRKVCLIKVEIFLRIQLVDADNVFTLRRHIYTLDDVVSVMEESPQGSEFYKFSDQILMLVKEVVTDVERYQESVYSMLAPTSSLLVKGVIVKETMRLRLLLKTLLIKGELLFLKLQDKRCLASFKYSIETLNEGLKIMIPLVIRDEKLKFSDVEVVASKIISLYHRILDQDISESQEMFQSMKRSVSLVVDEVNVVMKEFKEIYLDEMYLRIRKSDFPKTNAAGFIDSLLKKLQDLVSYGMNLVESDITKGQMLEIMGHLQFFQTYLESDISMEDSKHGCARLINICYEAEYLFDNAIHGKEDKWHNVIWMYLLIQEIREIKIQVSSTQSIISNKSVKNPIILRTTTPEISKDLVKLVDQEKKLIDQLVAGSEKLFSVSIVGMPGIGKTTLAKRVYNSSEVFTRFGNRRAWCCVSEIFRKKDVLLEILGCIIALPGDMKGMIDEDLEFKLYQILKTGRYLIVLDDVWDTDVLDYLVRRFPDNGDESRILITSRHNNVALKANPYADPHNIRQLLDSESWELLQMKIFREKPCPEEFKEIGMQIAGNCKGLPLAIIAIAGLLERTEMQLNRWKEIAESLSSKIIDPEEPWRHILELSYEKLPDCLKACFLYFGAFLEDQDIPARKLMQLWIAEGFVLETGFKTMEDVAEDYLMDLIGRSLVIISKQRSTGGGDGAKACRIHDVLRKLCQSKAKEDKFMQVMTRSNASNNANLHDLDYLFSANSGNPSSFVVTYEDHRLCFCSKPKHFIDSRPSGPHVRSLLCIPTGEEDPRYPYDTSFIYQNFRFLKVLDLECINIGNSFPQDILLLLLHLRYLAVSGYIDSVPESIANLRNLETFILKGLRGKVNLPHTIFRLKKLRHVCVSDFGAINLRENSSQLACLVTISSLILPFGEETDYILMQFPNLRKLKCIFPESHQFPNMKVLNQLESLNVTYYGQSVCSRGEFGFNSNLKKLTLTNFRLPWDKISAIGRLPNLEVLKLLSRAFVGEEWEMAEGEFVGLKYLKLEHLDVCRWNTNGDCLPKLQQLVLRSCKNLEIPMDIVEITTLQIIDVQWCGDSAEKSARQIREDGDEILKVFINFAELPFSNS